MHYDGYGLGSKYRDQNTDSAEECACACKHVDKCSFFTWTKNDKMCRMKTSQGKQGRKYGSFSGSVNCCNGGMAKHNLEIFFTYFLPTST